MVRRRILILACVLTVAVLDLETSRANAGEGHGAGPGHAPGYFHGWYGPGGFRGYYRYPGWYGVGVGFGLGYGYWYGYPYYPYYPYGYEYPVYVDPAAGPVPYPAYPPAGWVPGQPPPAGPGNPAAAGPVRLTDSDVLLRIRVPADAIVRINGAPTAQQGMRREFVSSGLIPGRSYTFVVTAQWTEPNGRTVEQERRISVQGGDRRTVDFLSPAGPPPNELGPEIR
jgi:uncharacterized protein (TIGR03000 family)